MILSNGIETDFHNMLSCPSMPIVKVENQRHVVVVMMLYGAAARSVHVYVPTYADKVLLCNFAFVCRF